VIIYKSWRDKTRLICILFTVFFSQSANAQIKEVRLKTLLSICETAQSTNDLGTIKNIANQLKDAPLQSDHILASRMRICLSAANGGETIKINAEGLVKSIAEKMLAIESNCNALLEIAPNVALDNKTCRTIFISNN
jgi:hypothetical protein